MGERTIFVRLSDRASQGAVVASRDHFPAGLDAAVRQKARWLGGIAFSGWDRLGWRSGWGERWFRMRDRKGPLAALLMAAGYLAGLLWAQLWLAHQLGAPRPPPFTPVLAGLLQINLWLLVWRLAMRAGFTWSAYGWREGLSAIPRMLTSNLIAILATRRALSLHMSGGPRRWEKTAHAFPTELPSR